MEYVEYDGEKLKKITISKGGHSVYLSGDSLKVKKIHYLTEREAKLETEEYIIRYIDNDLYLYDKRHNILGRYKFSKNIIEEDKQYVPVLKFYVKKNYFIYFFDLGEQKYYILNNDKKEIVVKIEGIGESISYTTEFNNILELSKNSKNSKWNGCPISKIN